MGRKKVILKKGGVSNPDAGQLLSENLKELILDKDKYDDTLNKYKNLKNDLEDSYKYSIKNKNEKEDIELRNEIAKKKAEQTDTKNKLFRDNFNNIANIKYLTLIFNFVKTTGQWIGSTITESIKISIATLNLGNGAIIRFLIFLLMILLIFGGIGYSIYLGVNQTSGSRINDNIISNKIINNEDNYIKSPVVSSNPIIIFTNWISSLIPDNARYNYNSTVNSINYIITGKNQYDAKADPRNTIEIGRSDNIFNFNFKNDITPYINIYTYSLLKPKDITFEYNASLYPNSDYNKLGGFADTYFEYTKTQHIPIIVDSKTHKYILNVNGNDILEKKGNGYIFKSFDNNNLYILDKIRKYNIKINNADILIKITKYNISSTNSKKINNLYILEKIKKHNISPTNSKKINNADIINRLKKYKIK